MSAPSFEPLTPNKIENKNMTTASIETLQTPFYLDPEIDPRSYLKGLGHWPGLPTVECRPHLKAEDKKRIKKLIADLNAAVKVEQQNDIPSVRAQAQKHFQSNNESELLLGEELNRASLKMDLQAFIAAKGTQVILRQEAAQMAAELALQMSEALFPEFIADAHSVEARLVRGGIPLSVKVYNNGQQPVEEWQLHQDFILSAAFSGIWFLRFYWPVEFIEQKYSPDSGLGWLAELVKED
jgi:hypothetical protein